jgi:GTP-binding protein Era
MQRTVDESLADVDGVLFVLAADERIGPGDRFIAARIFGGEAPVVVALNKVDRVKPAQIAAQIDAAAGLGDFHALHPVSAKTDDGVAALREELVGLLPEGPAYFPEGEVTDLPLEARIAELVREKVLALTREEVPHAVTVEVEEIEDGRVRALVYVETESQKAIVVGRGGRMIREIGSRARPEIELLLGRKVFLELTVKVRPRWRRDEAMLARLGI